MIRLSTTRLFAAASLLVLAFGQTACLKTRAQLREDSDDAAAPISSPTPVLQTPQAVGEDKGGGYVLDEIKSELTRLSGRVEDLERDKGPNGASPLPSADDVKKLQDRVVELEQAQANMLEAIKKIQGDMAANVNPADLLKRAENMVEAGNVEGSVDAFGACLKAAKGKVAEQCAFDRAESYFALKDYKKAIVDYSKFPEKFTHSTLMPKALYRIGLSFEALGMKDDAKGFYQELVEKYPKSSEAKKAKAKAQ